MSFLKKNVNPDKLEPAGHRKPTDRDPQCYSSTTDELTGNQRLLLQGRSYAKTHLRTHLDQHYGKILSLSGGFLMLHVCAQNVCVELILIPLIQFW